MKITFPFRREQLVSNEVTGNGDVVKLYPHLAFFSLVRKYLSKHSKKNVYLHVECSNKIKHNICKNLHFQIMYELSLVKSIEPEAVYKKFDDVLDQLAYFY